MKFVMECGPCDGDKPYALDLVDLFAEDFPGVAMKVQFFTPETITARSAPRYDRTDDRQLSQWDLFQDQLNYDDWSEVIARAKSRGVPFSVSVFSDEAVDKAKEMGVETIKVASGDLTNYPLLRHIRHQYESAQLVVSTGAGTEEEIKKAAKAVGREVTYLACHLAYPTAETHANLARIRTLRKVIRHAYSVYQSWTPSVGYSDHTPYLATLPALVVMNATMWEKHFSARPFSVTEGDHHFAIRPDQLRDALTIVEDTRAMLGDGHLIPTASEQAARQGARRSLASTDDIYEGMSITEENTAYLRPATGLPLEALNTPMVAARHIPPYMTITPDMVRSP